LISISSLLIWIPDLFLLSPQTAHHTLLSKPPKKVTQMTSLRLVSKKLTHAVQSYKARAGAGSQAGSQAAPKEAEAEARSGAEAKEPQLGAEPGTWSWEPKIWEQSYFFGSQKSRLPTLAFF